MTCGYCKAGFCALCLADCGADAHGHVPNCPENPTRTMWINTSDFNAHHSKRRQNLINEKLKNETLKVRRLICAKMEKDFHKS